MNRRPRELRFADDPGAINQWLLLGPLPLDRRQGLEFKQFSNEAELQPRIDEQVIVDGQAYTWQAHLQRDPVFEFSRIYSSESTDVESIQDKTVFAVSYLMCDRDLKDLIIKPGSDDQSILYLNGQEVFRGLDWHRNPLNGQTVTEIQLKQGLNRLVFRVDNHGSGWAGSVRITDAQGKPIEGLKSTLSPPDTL